MLGFGCHLDLLLSLLLRGKGDVFRASGLVGGVSFTGEVVMSWRTNWAV